MGAFHSTTQKKKGKKAAQPEKCFWCQKTGHRIADYQDRKTGKPRARKTGSTFTGDWLRGGGNRDTTQDSPKRAFQSFCFNAEVGNGPEKDQDWLVDSGCNRHMTPFKEGLAEHKDTDIVCTFGNKGCLRAKSSGSAEIYVQDKRQNSHLNVILCDVLYVPGLPQRMLSTGQLRRAGGEYFESGLKGSVLVMPDRHTKIPLKQKGDFLWLTDSSHQGRLGTSHAPMMREKAKSATAYAPGGRETASASLIDWHEALGHPHPYSILFLEQRGLIRVNGEKTIDDFNCRICKEAKSTIPHYQRGTRSIKQNGEVVHVDLAGPFSPDMNGCTYLMVFVDETSRYKCAFGLRTKGEAHKQLKTYKDGMSLKGVTVKCIMGDGAGELGRSAKFRQALINLSLKWESSPPYTHQ